MYVPHPHTSDVLANILMDQCVFQYNLENKISSIVVDNYTTNNSMMDILCGKFETNYLILGGKFLHMRCSAHILNLIVKDGLSVMVMALREFVLVLPFALQLLKDLRSLRTRFVF